MLVTQERAVQRVGLRQQQDVLARVARPEGLCRALASVRQLPLGDVGLDQPRGLRLREPGGALVYLEKTHGVSHYV